MASAQVNSLSEGRKSRKRSANEKERSRKSICMEIPERTIMTRSMTKMKQRETESDKLVVYVVVENPDIELDGTITQLKNDEPEEGKVVDAKEPQPAEEGKVAVAEEPRPVLNASATMQRCDGKTEWWEEWPLHWTYEEQWMWSSMGMGGYVGCRPNWEMMMGGTFDYVPGADGEEPWDDIWNLRGKN